MKKNKVVFEYTIKLRRWQIEIMVSEINRRILGDENPLTVDEVLSSPRLLKYLCVEWLESDGHGHPSIERHIDDEGWAEIATHRKKGRRGKFND